MIWLLVPARADSRWKLQGAFGSGGKTVAEARAERESTREKGAEMSWSLYFPLILAAVVFGVISASPG